MGLYRDVPSRAISDRDAAFVACSNMVISRVEPFIGMFVESCDEDRFSARSSGLGLSLLRMGASDAVRSGS